MTSGRDLLDQARLLSRWLNGQPQGWLASHRLMKTVRWDTVDQLPSLDSSGRTRLVPLKTGYRAQLKRLWLQKNWVELIELASQMYCEGVNHFWLDLQWYLWQGLSHAGQPRDSGLTLSCQICGCCLNVSRALKDWHGMTAPLCRRGHPRLDC